MQLQNNSTMKLRLLALALMMTLTTSLTTSSTTSPTTSPTTSVTTSVTSATPQTTEEPSVDDVISEINKDINDTDVQLTAGDILVDINANGTGKWPKYGAWVFVPVIISTGYGSSQKDQIRSALSEIASSTCVWFYEISMLSGLFLRHLYIHSGTGCSSYVGMQLNKQRGQKVSLNKASCLSKATIQHEILHSLGFSHEHARHDRDEHVRVLYDNIIPGKEHDFEKKPHTNNEETDYDFFSVMQYYNKEFSKNENPTLEAKENPDLQFGHATEMSLSDIDRVNLYYDC